jgi:2-dehydro-3-deoxy-D-arabinonate dehydratase
VDDYFLPRMWGLAPLLQLRAEGMRELLQSCPRTERAEGELLAPVDAAHEVWASGVTYRRSREAREAESTQRDVYSRVYDAERPELFFKANGPRVVGPGKNIRIRADSAWNVPEPELTLVVNAHREIVGYTAGNDVSSRDIEGENPLYLPQAKVYDGSCALGPGVILANADALRELSIRLVIRRGEATVFEAETRIAEMKRSLEELVDYLTRELSFPYGALLLTGTGIVPPPDFTLQRDDVVRITVGTLLLENKVGESGRSPDGRAQSSRE